MHPHATGSTSSSLLDMISGGCCMNIARTEDKASPDGRDAPAMDLTIQRVYRITAWSLQPATRAKLSAQHMKLLIN